MKLNSIVLTCVSACLMTSLLVTHTHAQYLRRALFLGNSYTYYNDLPGLTSLIAHSAGDSLEVASNTPGGMTLSGHLSNATSTSLIQQGNWDFVVLQEQSQMPSFPISQVESDTYPYAEQLNALIEATGTCAETMFYMTWGRENGDAQNCPNWPPVCTYEGMDDLLHERYVAMAAMNNGEVSPVGAVWRYLRTNHPNLDLYAADGSHPSPLGSYAAAMCFYTSMFRKSPYLTAYPYTLSSEEVSIVQNAVDSVVYQQLNAWFIGAGEVTQLDIQHQEVAPGQYVFTEATGQFAIGISFGGAPYGFVYESDTITIGATGDVPVHYTWQQCGWVYSQQDTIYNVVSGVEEFSRSINFFPNPAIDRIQSNAMLFDTQLLDMSGRVIRQDRQAMEWDIHDLAPGVYVLRFSDAEKRVRHLSFIKQERP
ncbi:MAG: T9SS type A sorting domain-containing protein [Flavobacteriales bacterium]